MKWKLQKCARCKGQGTICYGDCNDCAPCGNEEPCSICKGTGYTGLIIYDSVCGSLFAGEIVKFVAPGREAGGYLDQITKEYFYKILYDTGYPSIIVTIDQLRKVIEYREGEPWCLIDGIYLVCAMRKVAYCNNTWHKNIAILADNAEQAREIINACGGNG